MAARSSTDFYGRGTSSSQRPLPGKIQHSQETDIHAPGGIRAAIYPRLRPRGYWDRHYTYIDSAIQTMGDIETNEEAAGRSSSHVVDETESAEDCEIDMQSQEPIVLAMYSNNVEMLSSLLRDPTTNVDVTDEIGNTVLHCGVLSACLFVETDGDLYSCIDLLMTKHIKLNTPNKKGHTAIGLAVHHRNNTCVERMLKHPSSNRLYLDYYPGDSEQTVREIILQTYPELQPLLPAPLAESLNLSDSNKLLAALQRDKYKVFRKYLSPTNPNPWYDEPYHSSLLEIACQLKNRKQFVELLLENGAHPNIRNRVTGMPLLHATARSGNFELLEMFLEVNMTDTNVKDNEDRTILHWLAGVSEKTPVDKQRVENCLKLLLSSDYNLKVGIEDRDSSGNTALCIAAERRFHERVALLLINGANVTVLKDGSKILSASLEMLKDIVDDRFKIVSKPTSGNNEDELEALCSILSDGSLRQQRVLGHSTSRDDGTLQEGVEVDSDHSVEPMMSEDCRRMSKALSRHYYERLSTFLPNNTTKSDATAREGNTALHCAVMSVCHKGNTRCNFHWIDVLMNCQEMKLNTPNKHGYTALGYALNDRHMTCVEHMLEHSSAHRLYLDYYLGDSEYTVREIIMETYPELQPLLPAPLMESLDSSEIDIKLLAALQHNEYKIFRQNLDLTNPNHWYDEPYHSSLLEIACQMKDRKCFVKYLLDSGACPNIKNRFTGFPLLHATARSGNFEVLGVLLKRYETDVGVKDSEDRSVLDWWARVSERKPGDKQMLENCFELLMKRYSIRKMSIDLRDISGNTPLYMAVESGFRDRAKLLLSEGADLIVLEHGSEILLSASLSIVEEFLDSCLESNDKPATSKDLELKLNYRPLMKIFPPLAESYHHRVLLRHPVMSTFLNLRWQRVKFFFFFNMSFYVMFVLFLTAYILCSDSYNTLNEGVVANNTTGLFSFNDSYITSDKNDNNLTSQPNDSSLYFLWLSLMVLLSLLTLREMHQLIIHRQAYIVSLENWLEILLIIATFISCSGVVSSMVMKLHFSAVALLLGWLELLLMTWRLPQLSLQQEMLKTVSCTFLKFMAGYVLLLIAFALSFYILFKGSLELDGTKMFANPFLSVLKTIVMFTGEFEASSLSFDTFPYISHVIFLLFVVLVAIILLNLLNGLAVSDTHKIKKEAETLSLVARGKLISRIEEFVNALPKFMEYCVIRAYDESVIYPNKQNRIGSTAVRSLLSTISKETKPNKEREPFGSQEEWDMFTEKLSALQLRQDETQQILKQILTRLDSRECETTHL